MNESELDPEIRMWARSLHEVGRRAARKQTTRTTKWWVVECCLGIPDWQQCGGTYASSEDAQEGVEIGCKNVGEKYRDKFRIVAVVVVARTTIVARRTARSPTHD